QPVLCPARHYCPEGSAEPLLCPPGHVCNGQDLEALVNGTWGDLVPLAAGGYHTVVVSNPGQVWAAGYNDYGQLGTGGTVKQHAFVQVAFGGKKIVAVAAGGLHTAAITDSGELWTWGSNGHGRLGTGDTTNRHAPVKVSVNGQKIVAVAAGGFHTAALTDSGELWTWGWNGYGQLGVGDTTDRHAPVKVSVNGQKIVAVATGGSHTAAITDSGELWTWGYNGHGRLGIGDTMNRHAPVKVSVNGQKIVAVAAGIWHTAAITDSGELWTWGSNGDGRLGIGDTTNRHAPVKVSVNGQKIVAVAAGGFHTAALTAALSVKIGEMREPLCWSLDGRESSVLSEAFLTATWGSNIPQLRRCSALRGQIATFQQECRVQVGAWEATPCPAGYFCAAERVAPCSAGLLEDGGPDAEAVSAGDPHGSVQPGGSMESREEAQQLQQAAVETSIQNLEVKAQIWASQDYKKLEDQLQQAAAKQQDMDKTLQEFASRIAKVEQQWHQAAVDEKVPQQHLRACFQSLEATVQTLKSADDAQEQLRQASTDNASQPIEGLRRGERERANESAGGGDTAVDFRGTEALGIWRGLTIVSALIVSALAAGSFLYGIRMRGNSQ
ncbi:UVR8, partial [Symbiodinium necroappetens]